MNRRPLTIKQKARLLESQDWKCAVEKCRVRIGNGFGDTPFEDDHWTPRFLDGGEELTNRRLICVPCHRAKSTAEHKANSKAKRIRYGKAQRSAPMAGSRKSRFKKHMDGTVSWR